LCQLKQIQNKNNKNDFQNNLVGVSITKYQTIITLHHEWQWLAAVTPH
jgi:hypothetical protein